MQPPSPTHPGRLRLRFTQLKQQTEQLARMAAAMRAIGGVTAVETSPITGGLLIHFDPLTGKTTAFWDQVEAVLLAHQLLLLDPRPLGALRSGGPRRTAPLASGENSTGGTGSKDSTGSTGSTDSTDSTSPVRPPARQRQRGEPGPGQLAGQAGSAGSDTLAGRLARGMPMALLDRLIRRCAIALVAALF